LKDEIDGTPEKDQNAHTHGNALGETAPCHMEKPRQQQIKRYVGGLMRDKKPLNPPLPNELDKPNIIDVTC
jgi:hypothetical protein